jgi:hypothetical protein
VKFDSKNLQLRCINVGNDIDKIWFPSDKLKIVDWQPVTHVLDRPEDVQRMLKVATIIPEKNTDNVLNHAILELGFKTSRRTFHQVKKAKVGTKQNFTNSST